MWRDRRASSWLPDQELKEALIGFDHVRGVMRGMEHWLAAG
jgi:hypothetical protein